MSVFLTQVSSGTYSEEDSVSPMLFPYKTTSNTQYAMGWPLFMGLYPHVSVGQELTWGQCLGRLSAREAALHVRPESTPVSY